MAVVLIARPYGLLGREQGAVRSVAEPEEPIRAATPATKIAGLVLLVVLVCLPLLAKNLALYAGAGHRRADRHPVRHQPAFHHGAGRHAFVRARRLFRPRRLWRGVAGQVAGRADGRGARRRAGRGAAWRAAVRLVRGAAVRRLSRHAHARLCADRLGGGVPVGGADRRLERRHRACGRPRRSTRAPLITCWRWR